jgi:outer membrane protein
VPFLPAPRLNAVLRARLHITALATAAAAGLPTAAQAQLLGDADSLAPQGTQYGLGLAAVVRQRPYLDAGNKTNGLPVLYLENRWFRLAGGNADLKLWRKAFSPDHSLSAGLRVKYELDGYEADDSPLLAGMDERKSSIWGGGAVAWSTPWVRISGEYLADLAGNSKGQRLQLQADRRFGAGSWSITPRVAAQWLDSKYVDYYYGVRSQEARAGRAAYAGSSALTVEAGLRVDYTFAQRHVVYVDASVNALPDEIRQSPIVGRSNMSRVALGYMVRF